MDLSLSTCKIFQRKGKEKEARKEAADVVISGGDGTVGRWCDVVCVLVMVYCKIYVGGAVTLVVQWWRRRRRRISVVRCWYRCGWSEVEVIMDLRWW